MAINQFYIRGSREKSKTRNFNISDGKEKDKQYLIKDGILIQIKFPNLFHTSVLNIGGIKERPHI